MSTHHATQAEVASVAVMVSAWQARTSRGRQMNSATAPNTGSRMAVSYTHLDVYKRQQSPSLVSLLDDIRRMIKNPT